MNTRTKKNKVSSVKKLSSRGILTFSFGFLGLSIVGLSSYLRGHVSNDLQLSSTNWTYLFQLIIFHIFLFRYLLGNLAYLFNTVSEKDEKYIKSNLIAFFLLWIFILFQFLVIIVMGLSIRSNIFIYAFTFLIGSELLWSLFAIKDSGWQENVSRVLMLGIGTILILLLISLTSINSSTLLTMLYVLILVDCINDLFKNKENYSKILLSTT